MSIKQILGAILLAAGLLALVYRGFSYPGETETTEIGPLRLEVQQEERVEIPVWAGVVLALAGGALLAGRDRG